MRAAQAQEIERSRGLPLWLVVGGGVVAGSLAPVALHYRVHGVFDVHQVGMAFFFWLNAIIAMWEICLFFRIDAIRGRYEAYLERYRGREFDRIRDFFATRISVAQIFSMDTWADVWASYALFDESYADRKSFGFFIDIGNGFTTLIPSLLVIVGMTYEIMPARLLALMMLLISYQMFYGTLVYLTSFILNRRYEGHDLVTVALFVGLSNGLWTVFPLWAMGLALSKLL